MALSFAFDTSKGETAETLKRKRALADALLRPSSRMPSNVMEGLQSVGDALAGRILDSKLNSQEQAGQAEVGDLFSKAYAYPTSVAEGGSAFSPEATSVDSAPNPDADSLVKGLTERGIPEHIANGFVMNFKDESGLDSGINEKNPTVPGSRGGYGLYQLTGPRRVAYEQFARQKGVDPSDADAQLDFLVSELKGPESAAAKKIFATDNAGSAAAAIATNFLRPNANSLRQRVAKYLANPQAPVQVASLDPSSGMGGSANPSDTVTIPATAGNPAFSTTREETGAPYQPSNADFTSDPRFSVAANIPFANPQAITAQHPVAAALTPPQQAQGAPRLPVVSDALLRKNDQALGGVLSGDNRQRVGAALGGFFPAAPSAEGGNDYFPPAPNVDPMQTAATQGNNSSQIADLVRVINHPNATDTQKALAAQRIKEIQDQNDPVKQLQIKKLQREINAPAEKYRTLTAEEKAQLGLSPDKAYQIGADNKISQIGGGDTNVNVGGTTIDSEKKYDQTVGEGYGKDFNTMQTEAGGARKAISSLNAMEKEMENPNFYSGTGGTAHANLKRLAASMGLDPEAASSVEAFGALSKKAVLDSMGGSLGTGVSNADRDYIEGQVPTIDTSPAGNKKIIGIQRKLNERKIEVAKRARDYAKAHNGRIDADFYDELDQWSEDNPLFEKEPAAPAVATPSNDGWFDVPGGGRVKGSF